MLLHKEVSTRSCCTRRCTPPARVAASRAGGRLCVACRACGSGCATPPVPRARARGGAARRQFAPRTCAESGRAGAGGGAAGRTLPVQGADERAPKRAQPFERTGAPPALRRLRKSQNRLVLLKERIGSCCAQTTQGVMCAIGSCCSRSGHAPCAHSS